MCSDLGKYKPTPMKEVQGFPGNHGFFFLFLPEVNDSGASGPMDPSLKQPVLLDCAFQELVSDVEY